MIRRLTGIGARALDVTLCLPAFVSFAGVFTVGLAMGKATNIVVHYVEKEILLVGGVESLQIRSIT